MYVTCAQAFFLALPFMKRMSLPSQNTLYRTFSHNMQEEFLFLVYVWNFASNTFKFVLSVIDKKTKKRKRT